MDHWRQFAVKLHCRRRLVVENRLVVERSFLLVFFLAEPLRVTPLNELQANAHSGAIPKSFSSSESQLHGGACLGVFFVDGIVGIIENGEIRCLMSVMMVGEGGGCKQNPF